MMTRSRALARARLLLGKAAHVATRRRTENERKRTTGPLYQVGTVEGASFKIFMIRGHGDTWEEALDDAERYVRALGIRLLSEEYAEILNGTMSPALRARLEHCYTAALGLDKQAESKR